MNQDSMTDVSWWDEPQNVTYFAQKPPDERIARRLCALSERPSKKALDIGCGGGRHTELLWRLGFHWHACDVHQGMLEATRQRMSRYVDCSLAEQRIIFGSIEHLPYVDQSFDVVVVTGVLHQARNLHGYEQAIQELARVTRPGAILCVNIFTNAVADEHYEQIDEYSVRTREGLVMTLLSKALFYDLMHRHGLSLEDELAEDVKIENTGPRAILRAHFYRREGHHGLV